ncbi:MAG: pseudouridine-5'-phosphate glycosidase [Gemmatimonadota bacterium]
MPPANDRAPAAPKPLVALETTVIAHGLPRPWNVEQALRLEAAVREEGAEPRTIGIIGGEVVVGLDEAQIRRLGANDEVRKVSTRDLPVVAARGMDGATTVAATIRLAHGAGIEVFSTGGIGGVHRALGGAASTDVSADLEELARIPMVVVCSGAKAVLDLEATRETLETRGVTVAGYGTDSFPAFFSQDSGLPVDIRCDSPEEVAELVAAHRRMSLPAALLVAVPVPDSVAIPRAEIEPLVERAVREAEDEGLRSAQLTPFLLSRVAELTEERSLRANLALLERNARVAARIARAVQAWRLAEAAAS